jgi:subtilisin-like proprotein convertase family protein
LTIRQVILLLIVTVTNCRPVFGGLVRVYGGPFALRIPANPGDSRGWMQNAIIDVPDHLSIDDLDITVTISHTSVFDLQIFLRSPEGTRILLVMFDPFKEYFEGEAYNGTVFDDEADISIKEGNPPFEGRFKPDESLAVFDGQDAFGQWQLEIYDAYYADTGYLYAFEMCITVPEPLSALLLIFGCVIIRLRIPRRLS